MMRVVKNVSILAVLTQVLYLGSSPAFAGDAAIREDGLEVERDGGRDDTPPAVITDLEATLSMTDVILSWTPPLDDVGVTSYHIYQYDSSTGDGTEIAHILSGLIETYTVAGICGNPLMNFSYDVRAEDAAGNVAAASNIAGEFDYVMQDGPTIAVTPGVVSFSVQAGNSTTDTLLVSNIGDATLTVNSIAGNEAWLDGEFGSSLPMYIAPGFTEVATINVDAASLAPGEYDGVLSIGSNDPDTPSIQASIPATVLLLEMVSIPGGTFQMGSDNDWADPDEQPVHQVTVRAFSMAKYEVTNEEMREVMQWAYDEGLLNANSSTVTNAEGDSQELLDLDDGDCEISFSGGTFSVDSGKEDHPCIEVTWYGGQAFCNYLSDMEGLQRCISFSDWSCNFSANGYRLPTEAEWEYACRAGTTTDYYSGDETAGGCDYDPNLDLIGWYCGNDNGWTEIVGQKQANDWGLKDMSGNVWEWCNDWYGSYSSDAQTDPTGPGTGSHRVARGGGWDDYAERCRSANRGSFSPGYGYLGFRPARR